MQESKSLLQLDMELTGREITAIIDAMRKGLKCYKLKTFLSPSCRDKSNCVFSIMKCLDNFSKTIKYNPDLPEIVEEKFGDNFEQIIVTSLEGEKIKELVQSFKNISKVEIITLTYEEPVIAFESKMLKQLEFKEALNKIHSLAHELQEITSQFKTYSLEGIFNQLHSNIMDWAEITGKKVNFTIEADRIEIDDAVAVEIQECLIHLLRNAVDHGIESPLDRERSGKSQIGSIKLTARREAGKVIIVVEDDGRGIEPAKIKEVIEGGKRISGLSIVKNKLNALGGEIKIDSKLGRGTKFKLEIPLNLIMLKVLLINSMGNEYAIPLSLISEIYKIDKNEVEGRDMISIQGRIFPIISLRGGVARDLQILLVVEKERKFAIVVDDITGMQNAFIRYHKSEKGISGIASLRNGKTLPILDIVNIS